MNQKNTHQKINIFRSLQFIASYPSLREMPQNECAQIEVAFIGRSNSGKSTLLNTICEQSRLAKSGKTPGLTRAINVFAIPNESFTNRSIIDLPGYGYAKMSHSSAIEIADNLRSYLQKRQYLSAVVMLIDSRRLILDSDIEVLKLLPNNISLAIALSKVDKLTTNELEQAKNKINTQIQHFLKINHQKAFSGIEIFSVSAYKDHRFGSVGITNLQLWLTKKLGII